MFDDCFMEGGLVLVPFRPMLRRKNDRIDPGWLPILVEHGDLALGIWAEMGDRSSVADLRMAGNKPVAQVDGQRHQCIRFIAGVAEHEPLVTGALLIVEAVSFIDPLGDVRRLLVERDEDGTAVSIESNVGIGVADGSDRVSNDLRDIDISITGDFPCNHGHAGRDHCFTCDTGGRIFRKHRIKDRVGYLVRHLVWVAHRDRFRGKKVFAGGHGRARSKGLLAGFVSRVQM